MTCAFSLSLSAQSTKWNSHSTYFYLFKYQIDDTFHWLLSAQITDSIHTPPTSICSNNRFNTHSTYFYLLKYQIEYPFNLLLSAQITDSIHIPPISTCSNTRFTTHSIYFYCSKARLNTYSIYCYLIKYQIRYTVNLLLFAQTLNWNTIQFTSTTLSIKRKLKNQSQNSPSQDPLFVFTIFCFSISKDLNYIQAGGFFHAVIWYKSLKHGSDADKLQQLSVKMNWGVILR